MENAGREPEKGGTSGRRARQIFAHRILSENPLLIALLGLYPVAAACHTLKNALELSVMLAVLIPPAAVLFCCVGGRIPLWLRPAAVLACSAVLYLPAAGLMELIFPGAVNELGIFAGLMVCNSMMLSRLTEYAPGHSGREVAADAAGCALGYCLPQYVSLSAWAVCGTTRALPFSASREKVRWRRFLVFCWWAFWRPWRSTSTCAVRSARPAFAAGRPGRRRHGYELDGYPAVCVFGAGR